MGELERTASRGRVRSVPFCFIQVQVRTRIPALQLQYTNMTDYSYGVYLCTTVADLRSVQYRVHMNPYIMASGGN